MEENIIRVVVYGFLLRSDKKFLLVRRAANDSMPGIWEMPGGSVEIAEDPIDAIVREAAEETGLKVRAKRPLSVKSSYKRSRQTNKMTHTFRIGFLCELDDEQANVRLSHEHSDFQWVTATSLPTTMLSDFLKYTIEQMEKERLL